MNFFKNYLRYIHSKQWAEKRDERLKIDNFTCQICCGPGEEVHHKHYRTLGNENVETDLITLCRMCHKAVSSEMRRRRHSLRCVVPKNVVRTTPINGKGGIQNVVRNFELEDYRRRTPAHAQRPDRGSDE